MSDPSPPSEPPGIVPGRLDPYVFANQHHATAIGRLAHQLVGETGTYAIQHDEIWALQMAAASAVRALWVAISDHPNHCHGCEAPSRNAPVEPS